LPEKYTKTARRITMIPVRTRVARSESTPSRPIFAKMAVSAAKTAESSAQKNQLDAVAIA
jgi:hypothetical protein